MTIDELIAEILRLDQAATPGPWGFEGRGGVSMRDGRRDFYSISTPEHANRGNLMGKNGLEDAELIARYRTLAVEAALCLRAFRRAALEVEELCWTDIRTMCSPGAVMAWEALVGDQST